jgi:hypothetical protein
MSRAKKGVAQPLQREKIQENAVSEKKLPFR